MTHHACYTGTIDHEMNDGTTRRFQAQGPVHLVRVHGRPRRGAKEQPPDYGSTVADWGEGGLSARLFVGLNVGSTPTYTIEDVMHATYEFLAARGAPGSSFIAQKGLYFDKNAQKTVEENSVQVVVFNEDQLGMDAFVEKILELGKLLRQKFNQDLVVVEIQEAGVTKKLRGIERAG